jgi:hypothetical protein
MVRKEFARGAGEEAAVTLKVRVVTVGVAPARMNVRRAAIHLPDFHERAAHGLSTGAEDASGEIGDFANGGRDGVVDNQQVIIGIERHLIGIVRTFGEARRSHQLVRKEAGRGERG